ncbi:hypothetical protein MY11210_007573 [Beauveria gryllotalpidicola]
MPVGIAQVLNGTKGNITYHNLESGRQFEFYGRTRSQFDNDKLPSSETTDDTLPWYDSSRDDKYIAIDALRHKLRLCERDARFHIYDTNGNSLSFGHLTNGYRYVFRFDPFRRPNGQDGLSVSVYVYVDAMQSSNGEVSATMLQDHEPNAAMILVTWT